MQGANERMCTSVGVRAHFPPPSLSLQPVTVGETKAHTHTCTHVPAVNDSGECIHPTVCLFCTAATKARERVCVENVEEDETNSTFKQTRPSKTTSFCHDGNKIQKEKHSTHTHAQTRTLVHSNRMFVAWNHSLPKSCIAVKQTRRASKRGNSSRQTHEAKAKTRSKGSGGRKKSPGGSTHNQRAAQDQTHAQFAAQTKGRAFEVSTHI